MVDNKVAAINGLKNKRIEVLEVCFIFIVPMDEEPMVALGLLPTYQYLVVV